MELLILSWLDCLTYQMNSRNTIFYTPIDGEKKKENKKSPISAIADQPSLRQ